MTRWRTGTKNPHNIYLDDEPVGFILDPDLAQLIAERLECFPTVEYPQSASSCSRTYPLDPVTAEEPCDLCGRDQRKHGIRIVPTDPAKAPQARRLEHYLNSLADDQASAVDGSGVSPMHTDRSTIVHPDLLNFDLRRPFKEWPESVKEAATASRAGAPSEAEKLSGGFCSPDDDR